MGGIDVASRGGESAGAVVGGIDVASRGGAAEAGGAQSAIEISSRPPISTIEISSCCFSRPHASHAQRAIELRISGGSSGRTKRTSASSAAVVPSVTYLGRKNASQPGTTLGSRVIHSSASKLKSMSTRRSRKVNGPSARYSPACNAINGNQSGLSEGHQRDHASRKCPFLPRRLHATQSIAIRVVLTPQGSAHFCHVIKGGCAAQEEQPEQRPRHHEHEDPERQPKPQPA